MKEVNTVNLIFCIGIGGIGFGDTAFKWQRQLLHGWVFGLNIHRCD
jgi:hypothetical protein